MVSYARRNALRTMGETVLELSRPAANVAAFQRKTMSVAIALAIGFFILHTSSGPVYV